MPSERADAVILGALPQELAAFERRMQDGVWCGARIRLGLTGVGKPAAAAMAQRMIDRHQPAAVIFTGVAGALETGLRIGDIGVGVAAIDADLDLRALLPGWTLGRQFDGGRVFRCDPRLAALALASGVPRLFPAYIASGSAFLDAAGKRRFIRDVLPDLAADIDGRTRSPDLIEMEGSAVLQTAAANGIPALAIRAVSDALEGDAAADFDAFVRGAVEVYAGVVEAVLRGLPSIATQLRP